MQKIIKDCTSIHCSKIAASKECKECSHLYFDFNVESYSFFYTGSSGVGQKNALNRIPEKIWKKAWIKAELEKRKIKTTLKKID